MEEVHEEIGYWFVNVEDVTESGYEYINQYENVNSYTMSEFNFIDDSDVNYLQLAVF